VGKRRREGGLGPKSRVGGVHGVLMCEGVAGCKREKRLRV
jgi:hypothetical protein